MNKKNKTILQGKEIMECLSCEHESNKWLEIEGKNFVNDDNEIENEVFCPKCENWNYYLK